MKARGKVSVVLLLAGVLVSSGCGTETRGTADQEPAQEPAPLEQPTRVGYEGWWNATPVSGDSTGLPHETVAVRTDTGVIVDAVTRNADGQAQGVHPDEIEYTVVADPEWPENSVVIIDTETDEVLESFPVDSAGNRTR